MVATAEHLTETDDIRDQTWSDLGELFGLAGWTPSAIEELSGARLDEVLTTLDRWRRRIEALTAAVIRRADTTERYVEDGHRTVTAWAVAACNWSTAEARDRTRVARLAHVLPEALGALERGEIGVAQVVALGHLAANPRVEEHLAHAEEVLTDCGRRLGFGDFKVVCDRWRQLADQDGAHRDHDRAGRERRAHASILGRRFYLDAAGDVLDGSAMIEVLERFEDVELLADQDHAKAAPTASAGRGALERTAAQRRFDALKAIFLAAAGAGSQTALDPLVNLTVDEATLTEQLGRLSNHDAERSAVPPDATMLEARRCETTRGHSVDPMQALVAALLGQVRRVLLDPSGRVLDLGRRRRIFTGGVREAVQLGERHCIWPVCEVPSGRAQVDHVIPWSGAGVTAVVNGGLLCGRHNRFKTHGYRTWRDAGGGWHTYRPDGTEIGARPPPGRS